MALRLGNPKRALPLLEQALEEARAASLVEDAYAYALDLAAVKQSLGRHAEAEREALAILDALEHGVHAHTELQAYTLATHAQLAQGKREAHDTALRGVHRVQVMLSRVAHEESAKARATHIRLFEGLLAAARESGDVVRIAAAIEATRSGALLDAVRAGDAIRKARLPDALRERERLDTGELRAARAALKRAHGIGRRKAVRQARQRLRNATDALGRTVKEIQRVARSATALLHPQPADLRTLQAGLAPGDVLLLYSLPRGLHPRAGALVVTSADARWVDLGETADIEAAVDALDAADVDVDPTNELTRLHTLLMKPVLPPHTQRVLVSPDGALWRIPFSALSPDKDLVCVPSGTMYLRLGDVQHAHRDKVLAVGDPVYDTVVQAPFMSKRGQQLARLPATRDEAKAVGDTVLLDKHATKRRLREALSHRGPWRGVHLACHGLLNERNPQFSALALTPTTEDDGLLTALEVFRMPVEAELVVLSACETGRGTFTRGEGLLGLTTAFFVAGAPRVIASLWKVDDEATRALMVRFHQLWNPPKASGAKSVSAAEALRGAQAHVRSQAKWKHPAYWAAWILWGAP